MLSGPSLIAVPPWKLEETFLGPVTSRGQGYAIQSLMTGPALLISAPADPGHVLAVRHA